ncbi:MAG TPA: hypothetical protein DDY68_00185 [Porphyromonadaceae bacterium]|nr:hypothetical protein [Porphyromonadaceae bacterium]
MVSKKVIIITGGTSGIGEATLKRLSLHNRVYSLARTCKEDSENVKYYSCDITDYNRIKDCIDRIYNVEGRIDVLINCAGMGVQGAFMDFSKENILQQVNVNLMGTLSATRIVGKYIVESKGYILNIGSVAGELPLPYQTLYSATKSAISTFTEGLQMELKSFGVHVKCLLPGDVQTSFTARRVVVKSENEQSQKNLEKIEKDENNGMTPLCIAKKVESMLRDSSYKVKYTVGFQYHLFLFLNKILPRGFVLKVLSKLYS